MLSNTVQCAPIVAEIGCAHTNIRLFTMHSALIKQHIIMAMLNE